MSIKFNKKVFLMAFIPVFIMVFLQKLGLQIQVPRVFNPPMIQTNILQKIIPKLNLYPINYELKKPISKIFASNASYEQLSSYIIVDFDSGQILTEKNSTTSVPIASLTKLMTAIVAIDLAKTDDLFTVSNHAANMQPTRIGVMPGEKLTLLQLLHGLLLTSANDGAEVIEEGINAKYGANVFIKAMNIKAKNLQLDNTHFANSQGFDSPDNYSSAANLALLTHYALTNYPVISEIVKKDYQYIPRSQKDRWFDLYNWNGLLGVYPNVLGVKIGNTNQAGSTIIVLSEREGKKILVVVLGAPGVLERDLWAAQLLDFGFEKAYGLSPVNVTEEELNAKYSTWQYFG